MNVISLATAAFGAGIVFLGFFIARKIKSKVKANIVRVIAALLGFISMPVIQTIFNVPIAESANSGAYWFAFSIAGGVISKLFFSNRNEA